MTTPPESAPIPHNRATYGLRAAVLEMVRAYQDGDRSAVQAADTHLREITYLPDPDGGTSARDQQALLIADQFVRDWLQHDQGHTSMPEVYSIASRLIRDRTPAEQRLALWDAVVHLIAGETDLHQYALIETGLPGHAGVHLLTVVTAAIIDQMPPTTHLSARVVLEQQRRVSLAESQGMPGIEAAAYIHERDAAALLLKVLPESATMTSPHHRGTRLDLHALLQLYLLDHPFPTTPQEDAAVLDLIQGRLAAVRVELSQRARRSRTPLPRISPEDQSLRRRAERERRQAKKKRRP